MNRAEPDQITEPRFIEAEYRAAKTWIRQTLKAAAKSRHRVDTQKLRDELRAVTGVNVTQAEFAWLLVHFGFEGYSKEGVA